jgi:F0F1-type ATP synthase assembly protein I
MSAKDNDARARATRGSAFKYRATRGWDTKETDATAESRAHGLETGWTIVSYLIGGMAAYGGIGWLIGRAVHISILFPIGMLVGMAISLGYIIYRYGRQDAVARKEMTRDR